MAIINSYPLATPKLTDLVLGTSTSSTGQTSTKSFTVQSIKDTTAGVQTITTTIPATLNITGSGTANVTINAVTAAITSGGAALATGGDIYTFLTDKITGTADTVPIWTGTSPSTTLGDSLISQANNSVIINGSGTDGRIQLNCSNGNHGVGIQSPPHSVGATYTWILPQVAGSTGQVLTSSGSSPDQLTWSTNGNVGGTGTQNKLSKWSNTNTLADSNVEDTGTLVTISSAAKVTGDLELDADLIDVNGSTGSGGQLLKSLGGGNLGVEWINAPATGVVTVTSANTNVITVGGTSTNSTIDANTTAGVGSGLPNLATGGQIQAAIDTALAGAITFKGTFNANTGQITGGSDYLYNPGANTNTIAVAVGDMYVVSVAGNFFGNSSTALNVGDEVIAVTQSTISPSDSQESYYNAVPSAGGGITGGGTTNKVPLWTGTTVLGDSEITQSSTNIGIGTTSPSQKLTVAGSISTTGSVLFNDNQGINFGNSNARIYGSSADGIKFNGSGSEKMRLTQAGNLGIGSTNPVQKLTVAGNIDIAGGNGSFLTFNNGDAKIVINNNGSGRDLSFQTYDGSSTAERMRILSTGQVKFNNYTSSGSFTGTAEANLAVDSSGNIITEAAGGSGGGNRTVTTGTGDGTTTDFTMGVAFTSVDYVDVYISGVYQQKATYGQPNGTGTTLLRFTTAPPATSTNGIDFVINH